MTRRRPLIVAGSIAVAVLAGIWAGDAAGPRPRHAADRPALARLDAARVDARTVLSAATTPEDQGAAAREVAAVYRRSAPALPGHQAPLREAAAAYDALGAASTSTAYAAATRRAVQADSALASALRHQPAPSEPPVPPVLPLVLLFSAAAGAAVSRRRLKADPRPEPLPADSPRWDTPPPELAQQQRE